jgi:3'(2'), 5'-bisphosphate nucleotidase
MLDLFEHAALEAGKLILEVFDSGPTARYKADCSPVTEADERAERIILGILAQAFPDVPVVAEEAAAAGCVPRIAGQAFILVDPLDGTREFIARRPEFTVNIALVENGVPVAGVVYAPALSVAYCGNRDGACRLMIGGDFSVEERHPICARPVAPAPVAVASRSHNTPETDDFLKARGIADICSIGSSLKFCLLAEGRADIYPRFGRTMEWDTAAGDAILRAAGGSTVTLDGRPLAYGKTGQPDDADFANPHFIAWGRRTESEGIAAIEAG